VARMPLRDGDPSRIGRFRLTARLGAGGMGVVYLGAAKDGTQAAIKVLRPELADDQDFRVRFRREVAVMARVAGLCTVRVIEADTESATLFLATEYADGPSLAEYLSVNGPLGPDMLAGLAGGLAEALTAIHAAGVVHRDLKPCNVLLTSTGPKVIDFGIAQALDSTSLTKTGMTVGSPGFMAPEQILGQAGQSADVFAWGLTMAYAAGGQSPFGTGPTDAILYRIMHAAPDLSSVPERLRPLVEVALAKNPADRPTAADLLGQVAAPSGPNGGPEVAPTQELLARTWLLAARDLPDAAVTPRPRLRRYALALSAVTAAAVALGVGAALLVNSPRQAGPTTTGTSRAAAPRSPVPTHSASSPARRGSPAVPASSPTTPAVVQPGASPVAAGNITDFTSAEDYVAGLGYGSLGVHYPQWDSSAPLNAIVAFYNAGVASGPGKVFFFADGMLVGTDTTDGSSAVGAIRVTPTEIDAQYDLYAPGNPRCCPNGGTDTVRFTWTGTNLVALDPIPPASSR
jgi:eukaryotic-like serine/threonine-protein kinase